MSQNQLSKAAGIDEIEHAGTDLGAMHDGPPVYDHDDIHQAALADNPDHAERLNLTTLLSIVVSSTPRERPKH